MNDILCMFGFVSKFQIIIILEREERAALELETKLKTEVIQ